MFFLLYSKYVSAQQAGTGQTERSRGDDIEIRLVTIGPGDDVPSWWGHTALIVEDKRLATSLFYNYGLFSFEEDNFFINFAMGRLIFWVGAWNTRNALAHYVSLNRNIRIQILNLSPAKKVEMAKFLANNVLPENRAYLYDHYRDNCSTRIRDQIDRLIDGQFYAQMQNPSRFTYRGHTRRHTDRNLMMDWLLMYLMSDVIDQPILQWDDMFLPEDLSIYVQNLTYLDEEGHQTKLVETAYTYFNAKNRLSLPDGVPVHWPRGLLYGLILASITMVTGLAWQRNYPFARQIFGSIHLLTGVIFGIPGFALFFLSYFTDHTVTYGNENLLLANPLTFLFVPLGICVILNKTKIFQWVTWISYFLAFSGTALVLAKSLPSFDQHNWLSICLILPVSLSLAFAWFLWNRRDNFDSISS
jgi:hypothetical protein